MIHALGEFDGPREAIAVGVWGWLQHGKGHRPVELQMPSPILRPYRSPLRSHRLDAAAGDRRPKV